jgi:VIT1/CCC1 family predicted Fe2+/Mn2+ transporter
MTASDAEVHHQHRDVTGTGGWLRPAVFGAMDGLVSNFCLIAGVAGGKVSTDVIVLTGLAGLVAGAFSMAAGEYTSVAAQSELTAREIEVERREIHERPAAERAELAQLFVSRGVEPELADRVVEQLSRDPEQALEVHAREELGVDPDELPSPLLAAVSSFLSFAVGAFLPVLPYLLGASEIWWALAVALGANFVCGAIVSVVTIRPWWFGGLRQLLLAGVSAAATYGIGALVGVGVG